MKSKSLQKSGYNIAAVVFLVLALSLISIITSITNRNSEKLSEVVTNLAENKYEIDKIDEAIQLLYKAENNSRLYVVTRDAGLYSDYMDQLNRVSSLIVSVQKDDEQRIHGLVEDKKLKTELYISAKLLADSLLRDTKILADQENPPIIQSTPAVIQEIAAPDTTTLKKVVEEYVVEKKSKRGLFGRIRDAIANKPSEREVKSVTTIEESQANVVENVKPIIEIAPVLSPSGSASNNVSSDFSKLTEKEKALLMANSELFEGLKKLLETLKAEEIEIHEQRQLDLGSDAALLMSDLKSNNKYNLYLSLILTAVILSVLVLLYRNMKDLQKAKFEAEEHAQRKTAFVATLSHEMRTPLHSIHAFTDELSDRKEKEGKESEIIDAIKLSSNMLISVVNNILDFTKMEEGKFKLNHLPFVPNTIIQEVILGLAIQAKRKNLILNSAIDNSTKEKVYGDAFQLRQVLINIINNAIKYTEKGSISVSASFNTLDQVTGILELTIKDTGVGIPQEQLPYIFDEYNTQNIRADIKEGSTGLGLSIVKRIVNYHRGEIKVDSTSGKGSSFTIKLPYDIFVEKEETSKLISTNVPFSRVLLVENDPLNLKILNLLLVNENYIVTNSMNGAEAFEKFKNNDFDLVITDISIPGLSGFELARKIRALPNSEKASVPIIAISGFEKNEESEQSGISAWLEKPFDTDELLLTVKNLDVESSYIE